LLPFDGGVLDSLDQILWQVHIELSLLFHGF
jgi:hypothetical protein